MSIGTRILVVIPMVIRGVLNPPVGDVGHDLQFVTNVVGLEIAF